MAPFRSAGCEEIVFRAVLSKSWISDNVVLHQAFRRRAKDTDGVTVWFAKESVTSGLSRPTFGTISIHTGRVRDCSTETYPLDVIQDRGSHGYIDGIPFILDHPEGSEEFLALEGEMIAICRQISKLASRLLSG